MTSGWLQSWWQRFDTSVTEPAPAPPRFPSERLKDQAPPDRLTDAVAKTRDYLLAQQSDEGYWVAELEGDTILESEYILLLAFLGQQSSQRAHEAADYLRAQQLPDGGWSIYPGGPLEVSASVKAYLALRLTGHAADDPELIRARDAIVRVGGVEQVNSFTRYYLAMLGLIPYADCPAVPPEMVLLPLWAPLNMYEMSAWSRTIVVPLSLLWAFRPVQPVDVGIDELFAGPKKRMPETIAGILLEGSGGMLSWARFFHLFDRLLKRMERWRLTPLRRRAIRRAEEWICARFAGSDGLGAIFPPIIWSVIALKCLGYDDDSEELQQQFAALEKLVIREDERVRLQPCLSPVWDTALTTLALRDAGVPAHHAAIRKALDWLLSQEIRVPGDWSYARPKQEPGGWCFEFNNRFYPDVDDTSMVVMAIARCLPPGFGRPWSAERVAINPSRPEDVATLVTGRSASAKEGYPEFEAVHKLLAAARRGVNWIRALQGRDGGWGAFDADNNREVLTKVPFADHNAMIDPSTSDITARVLEMYAAVGVDGRDRSVSRALEFIWRDQQADHCWFGRWGVNYIYGTWQVLVGLSAIGVPPADPRVRGAVDWLKSKQQECGGWGETPRTYDDPRLRGTGPATASQTAWALLGLMAAGETESPAVERGVAYLLDTQQPDGTWIEDQWTGTGFPRVFYLKYHFYRIYFPLMALGRYLRALESKESAGDDSIQRATE